MAFVGFGGWGELLRFEAADDESIDLIAGPFAAAYFRRRRHPGLLQGPQRTLPGGGPVRWQRRILDQHQARTGHLVGDERKDAGIARVEAR